MKGREEHKLQAAFFAWLRYQYPYLADISFAIPNAAKRSPQLGAYLKAEGLKAGVWDVFIPWPTKKHPGLWLEFKIHPNKLTDTQKIFRDKLTELGYSMAVVYTLEEAVSALRHYIIGFERDRFK